MSFDYTAPAELFLAKRPKNGRKNYQRFTTAAEALSLSHRRPMGSLSVIPDHVVSGAPFRND